jgi:hypothetical protein
MVPHGPNDRNGRTAALSAINTVARYPRVSAAVMAAPSPAIHHNPPHRTAQ